MEPGITWYEVLGVLPGAAAEKIGRRYQERVALLRGEMIAGTPTNVLAGVRRAPGKVRRGGSVTVHVWHPPTRRGSQQEAG